MSASTPFPALVAFLDGQRIARGPLPVVARASKEVLDAGALSPVQVFDAQTGEPWDLDLSGTKTDVEARYRLDDQPFRSGVVARPGPGRPKLGVVAREVTLLPRHWEWLAEQPGGASAALRRLVDAARATHAERDVVRRAQERCYRFIAYTSGDAPGFEEAARALFGRDREAFERETAGWPTDVRAHALEMAAPVFGG